MGGELTVDATAAHSGLGVTESKAVLDNLVVEGGAQCTITADGVLVYSCPGSYAYPARDSPDRLRAEAEPGYRPPTSVEQVERYGSSPT
jgi:hypothetical protein